MAADFEISSLSGTGTATIRVKPKAVNEDMNNIKEQVLKVVVQGVEREVTLVQKAAPKIVETWGTYFSITPETTSHTFDGTKRGETLEIGVYSYQQKFIDNKPQDEYRAVDWKVESSSDWLEVTQEIGEANAAGKLTIKTKSTNQEHNPSNYDPLERTAIVKIISQQEPNTEIVLNITQSPGTRTTKYGFEPTPNIPSPNLGQNTSTAQISNGCAGHPMQRHVAETDHPGRTFRDGSAVPRSGRGRVGRRRNACGLRQGCDQGAFARAAGRGADGNQPGV